MARVFIAIRISDELKEGLTAIQDSLKSRGVKGNYCSYGNLHLTLAFIGENYDMEAIRKAVSEVEVEPFSMSLATLGSFPTKAGGIWCELQDSTPIASLAKRLQERLAANGVPYKKGVFFPHISLVQHPSEIVTDVEIPEVSMQVENILIMKSERIDGVLVYSEIAE